MFLVNNLGDGNPIATVRGYFDWSKEVEK